MITLGGVPYYQAIVTAENIRATTIGNDVTVFDGREVYLAYTVVGVTGGPENTRLSVLGGALSKVQTHVHNKSSWAPQSHTGGPMKVQVYVGKDFDFVLVTAALFEADNANNFQEMAKEPYFSKITTPEAFDWQRLEKILGKAINSKDPREWAEAVWQGAGLILKFVSQDDAIGGKQQLKIAPKPGQVFEGGDQTLVFKGGPHGNFDVQFKVEVQ